VIVARVMAEESEETGPEHHPVEQVEPEATAPVRATHLPRRYS
jgi:hypothetical protein